MGSWAHIHLEAFCTFNYMSKKKWVGTDLEGKNKRILENNSYASKTKRPKWCKMKNKKRIPRYKCFELNCPFFAYCDCDKKDYILFDEIFEKGKKKIEKKK